MLRYSAVHGEDVDAVSGGFPQGGGKIRVGGVVGVQITYVRHLNDEQDAYPIPFSGGAGQAPQVLRAPQSGGVREGADAVFFQRHAFDFQKPGLSVLEKRKIEPGNIKG